MEGLTWQTVERVCAFAETEKTLVGLRDSALIRLMSDCLLQVSEAVAVDVGDLKKNTLLVRSSKTDREGCGEMLYVGDATLRVIKRYRTRAGIKRGALFRRLRRGGHATSERLTQQSARIAIKRRGRAAGIEGFISGHSLRVGSAVSLAQAGVSVVDMQTDDGWKSSDMLAHYAKAELAERGRLPSSSMEKGSST